MIFAALFYMRDKSAIKIVCRLPGGEACKVDGFAWGKHKHEAPSTGGQNVLTLVAQLYSQVGEFPNLYDDVLSSDIEPSI